MGLLNFVIEFVIEDGLPQLLQILIRRVIPFIILQEQLVFAKKQSLKRLVLYFED